MKMICNLMFNLLLVLSCTNIDNSKDLNSNKLLIDSIRNELKINDSIQILNYQKTDSFSFFTIIDFNLNSIFHKDIAKQGDIWKDYQIEEYNLNYRLVHPQIKDSITMTFPKEIQGKWYEIYQMNDKFYLYMPCEFYMIYEINDSAFVYHYMDGNYPQILLNYNRLHDNFNFTVAQYNFTDNKVESRNISFVKIDSNNNIFLYKDSNDCKLLVNKRDLNRFPIIFESCSDLGINPELNFDEIKCK